MGYVPFHGEKTGNVPVEAGVQANRWTPAWYSGDPSTENPNAAFPRLSYGKNENNTKKSTFWKDNARYLRLQEISLTYNLKTKGFVKRLGIQSFDFQLVGYNLAVWSGVKTVDPEQAQKMGRVYPIPARYAFSNLYPFLNMHDMKYFKRLMITLCTAFYFCLSSCNYLNVDEYFADTLGYDSIFSE